MRRVWLLSAILLLATAAFAQEISTGRAVGSDENPILEEQRLILDKSLINDVEQANLQGMWEGTRLEVEGPRSTSRAVTLAFEESKLKHDVRLEDGTWERMTPRFSRGSKDSKQFLFFDNHRFEVWCAKGTLTLIEKKPTVQLSSPAFEGLIYSLKRRVVRDAPSDDSQASP